MSQQITHRRVGNTLTPISFTLQQANEAGTLTAVDLTGLTVQVFVEDSEGNETVAETATGVTSSNDSTGQVDYDFQTGGITAAGRYYIYFNVYNGAEYDTFPVKRRDFVLCVE
jgi:hypothetical protein